MFDRYLIVDGSLRSENAEGFSFEAKLGYYRGIGLSMVEELAVTVDGQPVPRENVRFQHEDGAFTLDEMEEAVDQRWEFGEAHRISVTLPGGLAAGEHEIGLREQLRVSYLPFPLTAADSKTLTLR